MIPLNQNVDRSGHIGRDQGRISTMLHDSLVGTINHLQISEPRTDVLWKNITFWGQL